MKIEAMPLKRKDAMDRLMSLGPNIVEHSIKVTLNPSHQAAKHWCLEIIAWVDQAHDATFLKGGKRVAASDADDALFHSFREARVHFIVSECVRFGLVSPAFSHASDIERLTKTLMSGLPAKFDRMLELVMSKTPTRLNEVLSPEFFAL